MQSLIYYRLITCINRSRRFQHSLKQLFIYLTSRLSTFDDYGNKVKLLYSYQLQAKIAINTQWILYYIIRILMQDVQERGPVPTPTSSQLTTYDKQVLMWVRFNCLGIRCRKQGIQHGHIYQKRTINNAVLCKHYSAWSPLLGLSL
ncbi:hypothetical protein FGO68_gene7832 [Halteria grandinella]|uniref:Uncharacterized protein n=1 Tax=Halteria grandinella TaxID=5974 RepID=A0A8J8P855_HALGN|nr:hypothetical protein FGO68_gene7832 [Halteria grandinella]